MVARNPEAKTVLALDQDARALDLLMACLSAAGYHVLSVLTAEDALRITSARRVDAIIVRSRTAGGADGFQTARELRANKDAGRIPIVLLHQNGNPGLHEQCAEVGLVYPLSEPFDNEQLTRTLTTALARGGFTEVPCCTRTRTNK